MNETNTNTGVSLEATLPIAWSAAAEISLSHAELRMQTNISLLRALAAIDVIAPEHETHGDTTQKALERVEAKMDVVLLMVAQLMGVSQPLPAEAQVSMVSGGIAWVEQGAAPAMGQTGGGRSLLESAFAPGFAFAGSGQGIAAATERRQGRCRIPGCDGRVR